MKRGLRKEEMVTKDLKFNIFQKKIKANQTLSERSVAQHYQISRGTARIALENLVREDILIKKAHVGYFLAPAKHDLILKSLTNQLELTKSHLKLQEVEIKYVELNRHQEIKLKLPIGTQIIQVQLTYRHLLNPNHHLSYQYLIPQNVITSLSDFQPQKTFLLEYLMKQAGFEPYHIDEQVRLESSTISPTPFLKRQCLLTNQNQQPLCFITEKIPASLASAIKPEFIIEQKVGGNIA